MHARPCWGSQHGEQLGSVLRSSSLHTAQGHTPSGTPFGSNREVVRPLPRDDAEGARG